MGAHVAKFTGDRLGYSAWRRKFFAMVHNQRMLVADKALALSAALDTTNQDLAAILRGLNYDAATYATLIRELERLFGGAETEVALAAAELFKEAKVQITSLDSVRSFRVKLAAYGTVLSTHDKREAEFSPNSQLYRKIIQNKFITTDLLHFHEQMVAKKWEASPEGLLLWLDLPQLALESADSGMAGLRGKLATRTNTETLYSAFTTTEKLSQATYLDVLHTTAIEEESHLKVYEDTPVEMVQQMLNIANQTGRTNLVRVVACKWKGKECKWKGRERTTTHLLRDCQIFKKTNPKGKLDHIIVSNRCMNCLRKNHRVADCRSPVRCGVENCGKKHNIALHDKWQEKTEAVAFLTRAKWPIFLLTTPVILSSSTSALQFDTNAIHDNGSTISLCSQEVADTIGLQGESRPLRLAVFGNQNQVQQAFKTRIAIADADGTHVGNAVVYKFVQVQAVDWSSHSKDFAHLRSLNFPKPFRVGRCHILLGNDNHHLTKST
jgi:hypothetical protein